MPYIMVMGSLSAHHLSKDEGATVYGLKSDERSTLVRELNSSFGVSIASTLEQERTVRVTQKGITLVVVNRLHALFGYDVVSHAMAMTNANRTSDCSEINSNRKHAMKSRGRKNSTAL